MSRYSGIIKTSKKISKSLTNFRSTVHNAVFKIAVGSGDIVEDDRGNYTFGTIEIQEYKVTLWEFKPTKYIDVPETDLARTYMRGYCVKPNSIDVVLDNYVDCDLIQDGETIAGRFTFIDKIPTALEDNFALSTATGQKITGYFERTNDRV